MKLLSAFGGLAGAFFVWCHRKYVLFMRKNKKISSFLQKKWVQIWFLQSQLVVVANKL